MAEILVIRLGSGDTHPAQWITVDDSGARLSAPITGELSAAADIAADRRVIVLLPSSDIVLSSVDLPIRSNARLIAALPYAMEEQVADDVEHLHFAAGSRTAVGRTPVAIVNREYLRKRLDELSAADIQPDVVTTELSGLAAIPGTVSLLIENHHILLNDGADTQVSFQDINPVDALAAIGLFDASSADGDDKLSRHVLVYCDADAQEKHHKELLAVEQELESLDIKVLPDGALPRLAVTVATGTAINLMQGEFASERSYSGIFQTWRLVAMLLLALGILWLGHGATSYYQLQQQDNALQQRVTAEFKTAFPWIKEIRDPEAQLSSLLGQSSTVDQPHLFLQSLEQLSLALKQNSNASIEAISYRDGVMDIRLTAPNVATLDKIQKAISDSGQFSASIQSTDQQGDAVKSRIQIQASDA